MGEPTAIRLEAAKLRCQQRDIGIIFCSNTPLFQFSLGLKKDVLDFSKTIFWSGAEHDMTWVIQRIVSQLDTLHVFSEAGDPGGFMACIDGRCRWVANDGPMGWDGTWPSDGGLWCDLNKVVRTNNHNSYHLSPMIIIINNHNMS